jgi:hypothetical protein
VSKRSVQSALTRTIAFCLVVLQLVLSLGLAVGFAVAAADFEAPSVVVIPLLTLGILVGVGNAWFDVRDPDRSYALRWLRRRQRRRDRQEAS